MDMLHIRPATRSDIDRIIVFIKALAEYEHAPPEVVKTDAALLAKHGFDTPTPRFHCIFAEWNNEPVGFALYFYNFSTWEAKPGLYLEDVFVLPEYRNYGIGREMLKHLARTALDNDCTRFVWQVLDWNTPAINFYERIGAACQHEWLTYRMDEETMKKFIAEEK